MEATEVIKNLRHKQPLNMFDRKEKLFVKIQFNKKETKFICWQRFVSKDRSNWVNWNEYLSLKGVMQVRQQIIDNNKN